jgi:hypothetical protein
MDGRESEGAGTIVFVLLEIGELHDGFLSYLPI